MHAQTHLTLEQLQALAKTHARDRRTWARSQAVSLAMQGRTAFDIAAALGCSRRVVQGWIAQHNRGGPDALLEGAHTGRRPRLAAEHHERLKQRLEDPPRPEDDVCVLRGADIRRIPEQESVCC